MDLRTVAVDFYRNLTEMYVAVMDRQPFAQPDLVDWLLSEENNRDPFLYRLFLVVADVQTEDTPNSILALTSLCPAEQHVRSLVDDSFPFVLYSLGRSHLLSSRSSMP